MGAKVNVKIVPLSRARSRDRVSVDGRCGEALERQDAGAPRRTARTWPRA